MDANKIMNIPRKAVPFILLQRGELQQIGGRIYNSRFKDKFYKFYEKSSLLKNLYRLYISFGIETFMRRKQIISGYTEMMKAEFNIIRDWLPQKVENIVGIGCGVGGLEVLLNGYYNNKGITPRFYLVDKSGIAKDIYYEYHEKAAHYNSLDIAENVLEANGVEKQRIHTIEADSFQDTRIEKADLVVSLIAWGYHFPVKTYIQKVYDILKPEGRLIIDIRKGTEGSDILKDYFCTYEILQDHPSYLRLCNIKLKDKKTVEGAVETFSAEKQ